MRVLLTVSAAAIAEDGTAPQIPAPMIRVRTGTPTQPPEFRLPVTPAPAIPQWTQRIVVRP